MSKTLKEARNLFSAPRPICEKATNKRPSPKKIDPPKYLCSCPSGLVLMFDTPDPQFVRYYLGHLGLSGSLAEEFLRKFAIIAAPGPYMAEDLFVELEKSDRDIVYAAIGKYMADVINDTINDEGLHSW